MNKSNQDKKGKTYGGVVGQSTSKDSGVTASSGKEAILTLDPNFKKNKQMGLNRTHGGWMGDWGRAGTSLPLPLRLTGELSLSKDNKSKETTQKERILLSNRTTHSNVVGIQCLFSLYPDTSRQDKQMMRQRKKDRHTPNELHLACQHLHYNPKKSAPRHS